MGGVGRQGRRSYSIKIEGEWGSPYLFRAAVEKRASGLGGLRMLNFRQTAIKPLLDPSVIIRL